MNFIVTGLVIAFASCSVSLAEAQPFATRDDVPPDAARRAQDSVSWRQHYRKQVRGQVGMYGW